MFVCKCCTRTSEPRQPSKLWAIYRTLINPLTQALRREVATEIIVCVQCYDLLQRGLSMSVVRNNFLAARPVVTPPPVVAPPVVSAPSKVPLQLNPSFMDHTNRPPVKKFVTKPVVVGKRASRPTKS